MSNGYSELNDTIVDNGRDGLLQLAITFEYRALSLVVKREEITANLAGLRSLQQDCKPVNVLINTARANFLSIELTGEIMTRFYSVLRRPSGISPSDIQRLIEQAEQELNLLNERIAEGFTTAMEMLTLREMASRIDRQG